MYSLCEPAGISVKVTFPGPVDVLTRSLSSTITVQRAPHACRPHGVHGSKENGRTSTTIVPTPVRGAGGTGTGDDEPSVRGRTGEPSHARAIIVATARTPS